jgi:Uma2 family endonuclease
MATSPQPDEQSGWIISAELRRQLLAALSGKRETITTMTFEDFLEWTTEDTHAEWVNGEIVIPSPANVRHQRIVQFLFTILSRFVQLNTLGEVLVAPFQMKLANSGREPDVLFLAREHADRVKQTYLDGPADLVVEIISPESIGRDRGEKFREYEQAGITEYWLIDPEAQRAEFYQLDAMGSYQLVSVGADGIYHSSVLTGFWLREEWLWQEPLPDVEDVLIEVGGASYARALRERLRKYGFAADNAQG